MARLIDAEEFEAYCIERDPKYSEAEWQAYLDGVQRVLEAIDAAPTMTKYVRCEDCDEVVNSIICPDLYYCIVVIRLALQMLGTMATVGIFVALPVLYALLWAALSREAFDSGRVSIEKIYNLEKAEDKEDDPNNKEDE